MRTWPHERLLISLKRSKVCAVKNGISKVQAVHTFSISISSVKRYLNKAEREESLAPKKRPGSAPKLDEKAMKFLEEDLKENPYVTLQERCEYMESVGGATSCAC